MSVNTKDAPRRKGLHITLWVLQVLLALQFAFAGGMKVFATDDFIDMSGWAEDVPRPLLLFIGIAEMLGALGLVVPRATGILPWLTPLAAAGLAAVMLLAAGFHAMRSEWGYIAVNVVLGAFAAFVAYGRWRLVP
jgi:uncharacterized membrane protein YphA (DoxX/SURF4 family)